MWELDCEESWVPKNWCFWTVVLEKTLESPLDGKGIKLVNKKFSPEYLLEGLMLKLKLQYFGYLMQRTDSFFLSFFLFKFYFIFKLYIMTPMLGKIEGRRRTRWQRMRLSPSRTEWRWVWASYGSWWWTDEPAVPQSLVLQIVGHDWATELYLCWG